MIQIDMSYFIDSATRIIYAHNVPMYFLMPETKRRRSNVPIAKPVSAKSQQSGGVETLLH